MQPQVQAKKVSKPQPIKQFHQTAKGRTVIFALVALFISSILTLNIAVDASPTTNCEAFERGNMPDMSSLNITFDCGMTASPTGPVDPLRSADAIDMRTVYFGVCDSGSVAADDLFNITFNGSVVSSNRVDNGAEIVSIGSAVVSDGMHNATLNSISSSSSPPATYSYAISTNRSAVTGYLNSSCGNDIVNPGVPSGDCVRAIPIRTEGGAPSAGKLRLMVQYGSMNQMEGTMLGEWSLQTGQYLNNTTVYSPAPQYARLWWQADGSSEWHLLPSQYWQNDGLVDSEYGVSCGSDALPSYHTAFSKAIPASDVPVLNR